MTTADDGFRNAIEAAQQRQAEQEAAQQRQAERESYERSHGDEIMAAQNRAAQESYDQRYGRLAQVRRSCEAKRQEAERSLTEGTGLTAIRKARWEGRIEGLEAAMSVLPPPPPPSPGPSWRWDEQAEAWVHD